MKIKATYQFRPRSDLGRFVDTNITPVVRMAVEECCQLVVDRAQAYCPVDTGALRASITYELEDLDKTIRGTVAPHMPYAVYVEFGTGIRGAGSAGAGAGPYDPNWPGMVAQPYMRPAYEESKTEVFDIFRNDLASAISV